MKDEITINLRALDEEALAKLRKIIDEQLNIIEDETNSEALDIIDRFED